MSNWIQVDKDTYVNLDKITHIQRGPITGDLQLLNEDGKLIATISDPLPMVRLIKKLDQGA